MRLGNLGGRAALISKDGTRAVDVADASGGRLGPGQVCGWLESHVEGIGGLRQVIVAP